MSEYEDLVAGYEADGETLSNAQWMAERTIEAKAYFVKRHTGGLKGRSEHDVTSSTYEMAQNRLKKRVDSWFGPHQ